MITIQTRKKEELIDITDIIIQEVEKSRVKQGLINIFLTHSSAALIIQENADPNMRIDILKKLKDFIPDHDGYLHDKIDNNAAAHIKSSILSPSLTLQIRNGSLLLGTWQGIMLAEFDGPKARKIEIMIIEK